MTAAPIDILASVFGYPDFRPGQADVVDRLLAGAHVLTVMPTGSGKSLCYQVPALARGGLTLVVSPLVALMEDQVAALSLAGVPAVTINSGRARAANVAAWRQVAAGDIRLLYLAPERLMTDRMLAALAKLPVNLIAIDEAHCISQWGASFRPEYEALARLRELFPAVPIGAFTATADAVTRTDIVDKLFGGRAHVFVSGFDRPNIQLAVSQKANWKRQLLDFLAAHKGSSGIVYCLSRRKTEDTAGMLAEAGYAALAYHAGMAADARAANQDRFLTDPGIVMVATIAFGMGIDKPDVRFVFHTDLPGGPEAYYQEIGRAGRDGAPAEAHMLYGLDDIRMRRQFIVQEDTGPDHQRRAHQRLDALVSYCESPRCRRRALLAYFGEDIEDCGNCDVCLNPVELSDGTDVARLALDAIKRTGQRFGAAHVIDVLRGAETEKIRRLGHDRLAAYGGGTGESTQQWRSILRQMVAAGLLDLDISDYGGLKITAAGRDLVDGARSFEYRRDTIKPKAPRKAAAPPGEPLSDTETALLDRLKHLRLELAQARGVPAYIIFSDRSLADMARRRPQNPDEFAAVHGVGQAKLRDLADPFLAAIADHAND